MSHLIKLSPTQYKVLQAIVDGATLKSHRYLDGRKVYKLHALNGDSHTIRRTTVDCLRRKGLLDSNKKFPAATYLLTEKGKQVAKQYLNNAHSPLTATNF